MTQQKPSQLGTKDELLSLLADHHRRAILSYFRDSSSDATSVEDLAEEISKQDHGGAEAVAIQLHHSALPRLADAGVVDYDARSDTVRYHGHSGLESLLDSIANR